MDECLRYATVTLRLTDGLQEHEWAAIVGFTSARLAYPVLGIAGCLQFFATTFFGDREEIEMSTNSLYPGT
jgi:hypothetical protein